ncbi:hypothetical protein [Evtepia sp.]|uniref:hypothetical protein n=1 Tax=Evtepia sp. TaxID=2773933 RepID=UPI001F986AAA|nr:hypothetical protein [Evtepia sp.]MEE0747286.1 hypothetical protein [Evtepia sp.]HJB02388.1 hypothetical protein [Candidatus Evtepia excrementipullorum]
MGREENAGNNETRRGETRFIHRRNDVCENKVRGQNERQKILVAFFVEGDYDIVLYDREPYDFFLIFLAFGTKTTIFHRIALQTRGEERRSLI